MTKEPTDQGKNETFEETLSNLPQNVRDLIPDSNMGYYKSTNEMHCDVSKPGGSKFLEIGNIFEVLDKDGLRITDMVAKREDDRQALLEAGADQSAFLPATKNPGDSEGLPEALYYKVEGFKGKLGIKQISKLEPGTPILVKREKSVKDESGKEKVPCSFSVAVDTPEDMPDTDFATVIIGREGGEKGKDELWTVHPGAPIRAVQGDFVKGSESLPGPEKGKKQEIMIITLEELLKTGKVTEKDYVKVIPHENLTAEESRRMIAAEKLTPEQEEEMLEYDMNEKQRQERMDDAAKTRRENLKQFGTKGPK